MCKLADHHNDPTTTAAPPTDLPFIPDNDLCRKTYTFASSRLPPAILNHSHRVFLYARHIATLPLPSSFDDFAWHRRSPEHRETLLFLAAMLHDLGACDEFNGDARFEVCGADAAAGFMARNGLGGSMRDDVWTAIACHTSPGIAEGVAPLARILRLAVLCDFDRPGMRSEMGVLGMCEGVEAELPRMDIERVLGDAVVAQVRGKEEGRGRETKAPGNSWPGALWKGELEMREKGVEGVNIYF